MCRAVSRIVLYYIMFFLELLNSQKKKVHPVKITKMEESSKKDDSKCPKCGFTKFEIKDTTGQKSCMQCGYILENYGVVNDVSFNKDGGGGSTLNATFISSEHNAGTTDYHKAFGYRNYRQQIERSAKQKIDSCCNRLGCTAIAEPALQYFKMALINKHTRGRKVEYTIGACLYLACRQNTRPFMLIDFADELDIDVFHLGKAYQILADRLELKERYSIDPTIYIERLVKKLDFKEHSDEVREMAVRLVKRMKKDWIDKGRRPTGLCGAAILMAAKAQDFQICFQDISRVAKIGHATIKKRLSEFESTNASNLSINEFNKIGDGIEDFGEESHPPSFKHDIEDQIEKTFEHQSQVKDNILKLAEMFDKEIESAGNKQSKYSKAGSVVGDSENVNVKSERSVTDSEVDSRKQRVPEIQWFGVVFRYDTDLSLIEIINDRR